MENLFELFKHTLRYARENHTQLIPCDPNTQLNTNTVYISRLLVPTDETHTAIFHHICHQNSESILVYGMQVYHHLRS